MGRSVSSTGPMTRTVAAAKGCAIPRAARATSGSVTGVVAGCWITGSVNATVADTQHRSCRRQDHTDTVFGAGCGLVTRAQRRRSSPGTARPAGGKGVVALQRALSLSLSLSGRSRTFDA